MTRAVKTITPKRWCHLFAETAPTVIATGDFTVVDCSADDIEASEGCEVSFDIPVSKCKSASPPPLPPPQKIDQLVIVNKEVKKTFPTRFSFGFRPMTPEQLAKKPAPSKNKNTLTKTPKKGITTPNKPLLTKIPKISPIPQPQPLPFPTVTKAIANPKSNIKNTILCQEEVITIASSQENELKSFPSPITPLRASKPKNISPGHQTSIHTFFGGDISSKFQRKPKTKETTQTPSKKATGKRKRTPTTKEPPKKRRGSAKQRKPMLEIIGDDAIDIDNTDDTNDRCQSSSPEDIIPSSLRALQGISKEKLTKNLPTVLLQHLQALKVKHNEICVDFEVASKELFSLIEVGKRRKKKKRNSLTAATLTTSQKLLQILTSIPCSKKDPESTKYLIPLVYHTEIVKTFRNIGITVHPIPMCVLKLFLKKKEDQTVVDFSAVSPELIQTLFPFQLRGVKFALQKNGRCLLGDEMGLGKTIQGITIAACYREEWPLLVICPSSVRDAWAEELMKWLHLCPLDIGIITAGAQPIDSLVTIVSYDLVPRMPSIEAAKFKVVIADESHSIKTSTAQRTVAIVPILKKANRVILLSGTPALSRPIEVFTQLDCIRPDIFPQKKGFDLFARRYCAAHKGAWGLDTKGASHLIELHTLLTETVMIRRKKQDVLTELPSKTRHTIDIEVEVGQPLIDGLTELRQLEHMIHKYGHSNPSRASDAKRQKLALTTELFTETSRSKIPAVQQYVSSVLLENQEKKYIVFAHHKTMMDGIEEVLKRIRVGFIRLEGKTPANKRQPLIDQFQKRSSCRVALVSITAGGTGITLHAASSVIFAELWWTPAILQQAEDRAHRIGQTHDVHVYYLLGKKTLDEAIWPLVSRKLDIVGKTIDGMKDVVMGALPMEAPTTKMIPLEFLQDDEDDAISFQRFGCSSSSSDENDDNVVFCSATGSRFSFSEPRPKRDGSFFSSQVTSIVYSDEEDIDYSESIQLLSSDSEEL